MVGGPGLSAYFTRRMVRSVRRAVTTLAAGSLVFLVTMIGIEAGFRIAPGLIPEDLLKRFEPTARGAIAARRFLPNASQTWEPERSDGGPPIKLFEPHAEFAYTFVDTGEHGRLRMDALGFCNPPADAPDRAHIPIVAIGDSFTACHAPAPERTWPSLLGRTLGRGAYNLGRGGYGPYEYLELLRLFGLQRTPEVVVMQIYEGNDLRDAARYFAYRDAGPTERRRFLERAGWNPLRFEPAAWLDNALGRSSWAYDFVVVGSAVELSNLVDTIAAEPRSKIELRYTLELPEGPIAMNGQNNDRDELRTARDVESGALALELFDPALDRFAALARAHGFLPVVAYAPAAYTAYAELVRFRDPSVGAPLAAFSARQRAHLATATAARGLTFVDLTPAFQAAARERGGELLYYPLNVHYTPAGQRVVADTLAAAIRSRLAD
jgi:hypothetical protein